jgi:hypothetical protein
VDSGTEWTRSQFVLRNVEHVTGDTHDLLIFESDFFESDSGQRMHARTHITMLFNAQGEPTAFRWEVVDCKLVGTN